MAAQYFSLKDDTFGIHALGNGIYDLVIKKKSNME